jgi:hypothetical protein
VGDVALKVPLSLFTVARGRKGSDPAPSGIEVLGNALDNATFASGIATLDHDDDPLTLVADPLLQLHQLLLELQKCLVVYAILSHVLILPFSNP